MMTMSTPRPREPHATRRVALLGLVALVAACGPRTSDSPFTGARGGEVEEIRLTVENRNFNDLRVRTVSTRGPQPLGQVGGNTSRVFRIPWRALDEIRFEIEVLAGEKIVTNPINVSPGDRLELVVPDNPYNSILRRR